VDLTTLVGRSTGGIHDGELDWLSVRGGGGGRDDGVRNSSRSNPMTGLIMVSSIGRSRGGVEVTEVVRESENGPRSKSPGASKLLPKELVVERVESADINSGEKAAAVEKSSSTSHPKAGMPMVSERSEKIGRKELQSSLRWSVSRPGLGRSAEADDDTD